MAESITAARAKIEKMHADVMRKNYFQVLGVDVDADVERIRASYHLLAKRWHSDAYTGMDLGDSKTKLDEIFQRIGEAYETLTNPQKRGEYLILLDRQQKGMATDVNQILYAEQVFDEALANMRRRDWAKALELVEKAVELNPDDQLYKATKGWVTFHLHKRNEGKVKEAVEILKQAVKAQENLPIAYSYIGQIHFAREEHAEAKKWFKKCLEWDSNNVEAARLLRLVNSRQEKKNAGLGGFFGKLFGGKGKK